MVEVRLGLDPSRTQNLTTALLAVHELCSLVSAPIIAHFAYKTPNRKYLLLSSLAGCVLGTSLVACTPSGMSVCPFRKGGLGRFDRRLKLDVTATTFSMGVIPRTNHSRCSGSATWISSFAMLVDNIESEAGA